MASRRPAKPPEAPSAAPPPPIPLDLVHACYRQLLGREPENADVARQGLGAATYDALLAGFLTSEEFARRFPPAFRDHYLADAPSIDVAVAPEQLQAMFGRIRQEWSSLGEADPYWSVLTDEAFRGDALETGALEAFFGSGAETAHTLDVFADRCGVGISGDGVCLEFGCGVGRVTAHLARRFAEVVAVDISAGNLAVCEAMLKREGIDNVRTVLIGAPEAVEALPTFDVLFSTIVFQHNPPPVQRYLLDVLLGKVTPFGAFLFQVATHTPGYAFNTDVYLASPPMGMEMHCLPMPEVMRLIARHGLTPLEVLMDGWTGLYGSHTFFGVRRP